MKNETTEALLFAEWILENAYQSYDNDVMMWDYDDVLYTTRDLYIEFINEQRKK